MSHIATYVSNLSGVNLELLKKAVEIAAQMKGVQMSDTIDSYDEGRGVRRWKGHEILWSIRTDDCPQGLGICLKPSGPQGHLVPVYVADELWLAETTCGLDRSHPRFWPLAEGSQADIKRIQSAIEKNYVVLATVTALMRQGFQVKTEVTTAGLRVVRGVKAVRS